MYDTDRNKARALTPVRPMDIVGRILGKPSLECLGGARPVVSFRDLNNDGSDRDSGNVPHTAVEIGLKWSF